MTAVLEGERIVLTRSADDSGAWAERLAQAGAQPVIFPCIATELIAGDELAHALAAALRQAHWLIFTSRRGVDAYVALGSPPLAAATRTATTAAAATRGATEGTTTRVAAVGEATASAARAACGRVDVVGSGTALALGRKLAASADFHRGDLCLLVVAENAGPALAETLAAAGGRCRRFDVYRTVPSVPRTPRSPWSSLDARKVIFASPTAVTGFFNQLDVDDDCEAFTIGPSTSAAARERGLSVIEAREPSLDAIIESIKETIHV